MGSLLVLGGVLLLLVGVGAVRRWNTRLEQAAGESSPNRRTPIPDDIDIPRPPENLHDPAGWDRFWEADLAIGGLVTGFNDAMAHDEELPRSMAARDVRTVLCAGNGLSSEAARLAASGYKVTALDLSPTATRVAAERWHDGAAKANVEGSLTFVCGDLFDRAVCPGPYDAIIERRTLQLFEPTDRELALERLTARLALRGLLVSHCHLGYWRPGESSEHFARAWLDLHGFGGASADRAYRLTVTTG
jgi:hypothetical protein